MNNEFYEDDEIDLLEVFAVVKKNLLLLLAILILCCSVGFALSEFVLDETYEATSRIIIVKDESNSSSSTVTYNDVQLSQKLVSTYKQILKSEAISDVVIANLNLDKLEIDSKKYNDMVEVTNADSTEVMSIQVVSKDPKLSADMANEIVDVFMSKIYGIMKVQNVTVLDEAKVPTQKHGPSVMKFTAIGGGIGLFICALIVLIKFFTDTKVKTEEEVKAIFDYPIIGTIPNFIDKEIEYNE